MPLNPVARSAIEELRRVFHVADLTPDEVVELNDLGAAQMAAGKNNDGISIRPPILVGNVLLHPLTMAAADFLERFERSVPRKLRDWFFPWLLAHSRSIDVLESIHSESDLAEALKKFRRCAAATCEELDEATSALLSSGEVEKDESMMERILAVADFASIHDSELGNTVRTKCVRWWNAVRKAKEKESAPEYGRWKKFALELGVLTGVSPEYWYGENQLAALIAYRKAQEVESARAIAFGASKSDQSPDLVAQLREMRDAMTRIVNARKERSNGKEGS